MGLGLHFVLFGLLNLLGSYLLYRPIDHLFSQGVETEQAKNRMDRLTRYSTGWIFILGFSSIVITQLPLLLDPTVFSDIEVFSVDKMPVMLILSFLPPSLFIFVIFPAFITYFLINDFSLDLKEKAFNRFQILYPAGKKRIGFTLLFVFVILVFIPALLVILELEVALKLGDKYTQYSSLNPLETVLIDRFVVFVGMIIAVVLLTRSFTKPIYSLLRKINRVREGDYSIQAAIITEDEIGVLTKEFNEMVHELEISHNKLEEYSRTLEKKVEDRTQELKQKNSELEDTLIRLKQMQKQAIVQEKMASLGSLVAGIAHEINTPIGAVSSMYDTLSRTLVKMQSIIQKSYPDEFQKSSQLQSFFKVIENANKIIRSGTERVTTIVRRLKSFARLDEAEIKTVDIHEGLEDTLILIHHDIKHNITIKKDYGEIPRVSCYPGRLNQVFLNLLVNSKQAIEGKGKISISTRARDNKVYITFKDDGIGISKENLKKVFDPGYTTRGRGVGTGLGLSISYQIIQDHRGEINVKSELQKGTTFEIVLPLDLEDILEREKRAS
jgi:signal transduction histidine kinase